MCKLKRKTKYPKLQGRFSQTTERRALKWIVKGTLWLIILFWGQCKLIMFGFIIEEV
jgi:hypothetical protein